MDACRFAILIYACITCLRVVDDADALQSAAEPGATAASVVVVVVVVFHRSANEDGGSGGDCRVLNLGSVFVLVFVDVVF